MRAEVRVKTDMKLIAVVFLMLVSALAAACGGAPTSTPLPPVPPTQTPTPAPTPEAIGYVIQGEVLASSTSVLLGGQVILEPIGRSVTTDLTTGSYAISEVPDGEYNMSVAPRCVAYGCYYDKILVVSGADILDFHIAPLPALLLPGSPKTVRSLSKTVGGTIPLDEVELAHDYLTLISPTDLQAGDTVQIVLAGPACIRCEDLLVVDAAVTWSVEPSDGASIDVDTGLLAIAVDTPTGSAYTVTADVGEGQFSVSSELVIYSAEEIPVAGVWTETATGNINQLLLTSGGEFAVTANPYEHYQDYWGTYTFDLATGDIQFTSSGANQSPPDGDGTGTFTIDADGKLILESICLGGWDASTLSLAKNCGHEFEK